MQKNKRSDIDRRPHRATIPNFPDVACMDQLAVMLDDELISRFRGLDDERLQAVNSLMDPQPWEVELAYVRRELAMRRVRREHHDSYLRSESDTFARSEEGLPAGDFDNSAFVYAASGGRPRWN